MMHDELLSWLMRQSTARLVLAKCYLEMVDGILGERNPMDLTLCAQKIPHLGKIS